MPAEYIDEFKSGKTDIVYAGSFCKRGNVSMHTHPCPELILINQGSCDVHINGRTFHAKPHDMIIIPAHQTHDQVSNEYVETVYCGFTAPPTVFCSKPRLIPVPDTSFIEQCMRVLAATSLGQTKATSTAINFVLSAVLEQLQHQHSSQQGLNQIPPMLRIAVRYLNDNFDKPISIETLTDHIRISTSNLHQLFRTHLHTTPIRYLHDRRMQAARSALLAPYLSIKEIAVLCGYPDVNYFVRVFRKTHGCPPGQWRQQEQLPIQSSIDPNWYHPSSKTT